LVRSWGTPLPVYCPLLDPFVKPQDKQWHWRVSGCVTCSSFPLLCVSYRQNSPGSQCQTHTGAWDKTLWLLLTFSIKSISLTLYDLDTISLSPLLPLPYPMPEWTTHYLQVYVSFSVFLPKKQTNKKPFFSFILYS
jgi:hypothetical protein